MRGTTLVSIRSCTSPVDSGRSRSPSSSSQPSGATSARSRASGSRSGSARSMPSSGDMPLRRLGSAAAEARQALPVRLDGAAALRAERDLLEPGDLPLALDPGRVIGREAADQVLDAVAQLEGEVGGRRAHQLPHVLDSGLPLEPVGPFVLAHGRKLTGRWTAPAPAP